MVRCPANRRHAVTLIEILVVVGIISALLAILLPAISSVRESSRRTQCKNNLRQLALGVDLYHDAFGRYPPGQFQGPFGEGPTSKAWSWLSRILPNVGEQTLHAKGNVPKKSLKESGIADRQIELFLCPSDGYSNSGPRTDAGNLNGFAVGQTNYKAVMGANWGHDASQKSTKIGTDWTNPGTNRSYDGLNNGDGIMYRSDFSAPRTKARVTDGLDKTFMLGEDLPEQDIWCSWAYSNNAYSTCAIPPNVAPIPGKDYSPGWWPNVQSFRSRHSGGLHFAFANATVRFISDEIDLTIYRALATIGGGELVAVPE